MQCPGQADLLRRLNGESSADSDDSPRAHAANCPDCAAVLATWDALGNWTVTAPPDDGAMVAAVLSRAASARRGWGAWIRVAAVLAIASGAGWGAAIFTPVSQPLSMAPEAVDDQQVVEALGLDALAEPPLLAGVIDAPPIDSQEAPEDNT